MLLVLGGVANIVGFVETSEKLVGSSRWLCTVRAVRAKEFILNRGEKKKGW